MNPTSPPPNKARPPPSSSAIGVDRPGELLPRLRARAPARTAPPTYQPHAAAGKGRPHHRYSPPPLRRPPHGRPHNNSPPRPPPPAGGKRITATSTSSI